MATICATPTNVEPVIAGPVAGRAVAGDAGVAHQRAAEPARRCRPASPAMLEPAPTWQVSHDAAGRDVVARQADDAEAGRRDREARRRRAVALRAVARRALRVGMDRRPASGSPRSRPLVWQAVHCAAAAYGMWLAGLSWAVKKLVPLWHCEQSPLDGCAASATLKVPAAVRGRVWKPVYCAPARQHRRRDRIAAHPHPDELAVVAAEQPLVMPAWICAVVGTGGAKARPGRASWPRPRQQARPAWTPGGRSRRSCRTGCATSDPPARSPAWRRSAPTPTNVEPLMPGPWQAGAIARDPGVAHRRAGEPGAVDAPARRRCSSPGRRGRSRTRPRSADGCPAVPTTAKPAAGIAKLAAAAPWHCAQLLVGWARWRGCSSSDGITEKSPLVWQAVHCRCGRVRDVIGGLATARRRMRRCRRDIPSSRRRWVGGVGDAIRCRPVDSGRVWKPRYCAPAVTDGRRDRIRADADPRKVAVVAGVTAAGHAGMDLQAARWLAWRSRCPGGRRTALAGDRPGRLAREVAAFAAQARRNVRSRSDRRARRHDDDAGDAGERRRRPRPGRGTPRSRS